MKEINAAKRCHGVYWSDPLVYKTSPITIKIHIKWLKMTREIRKWHQFCILKPRFYYILKIALVLWTDASFFSFYFFLNNALWNANEINSLLYDDATCSQCSCGRGGLIMVSFVIFQVIIRAWKLWILRKCKFVPL